MKVFFAKKAEQGLDKIYSHIVKNFDFKKAHSVREEIVAAILKLEKFPELGLKIGGDSCKRFLVVSGNLIIYEIVISKTPFVVIRNIKPRKTK